MIERAIGQPIAQYERANGTAAHAMGRTGLYLEARPPQETISERATRSTVSARSRVANQPNSISLRVDASAR